MKWEKLCSEVYTQNFAFEDMYYSDSKAIKILILYWVKKNSVFISCKQLEDSPQKNPVHHFLDFKTVYMEY